MLTQRFASGGKDYLEQNFMRVMIDSAQLAEEAGFIDLYFDDVKAAKITEHWLEKYEKKLAMAEKIGLDEYRVVVDDMKIDVIAELATPVFRNSVNDRLQMLFDQF